MNLQTSLRAPLAEALDAIGQADILVGIPCYNNEQTIGHVLEMVSAGLRAHYADRRAVVLVSDGGSTDDTREVVDRAAIAQPVLVSIYRGIAGKGTALRSIFEAGERLRVRGYMVVDADLRSITGDWVRHLLDPVLERGHDFVAPIYTRYKYDGTITNNIVYNLTRALYGKRIRQPIGGDFAFSPACARYYLSQPVWDTDIARFGIDIWMTTSAIVTGLRICQSRLGVKVHDAKDPSLHLAPMFRQVIYTLFSLMEENELYWKTVIGSEPTEIFGDERSSEPDPVTVNLGALCRGFRHGFDQFGFLWERIFSPGVCEDLRRAVAMPDDRLTIATSTWIDFLYQLAATFHGWRTHRVKLLNLATPLYQARVASFINTTRGMDSREAEALVEEQAQAFEDAKRTLIDLWNRPRPETPADAAAIEDA